jgi:hypothetical protein
VLSGKWCVNDKETERDKKEGNTIDSTDLSHMNIPKALASDQHILPLHAAMDVFNSNS